MTLAQFARKVGRQAGKGVGRHRQNLAPAALGDHPLGQMPRGRGVAGDPCITEHGHVAAVSNKNHILHAHSSTRISSRLFVLPPQTSRLDLYQTKLAITCQRRKTCVKFLFFYVGAFLGAAIA